jgi:hypothetical protein
MSLDITLNRLDRVYHPGDKITGTVIVESKGSSLSYNSIRLLIEGTVTLTLSARSIGLFEAFYSSLKPIQILNFEIQVSSGGKCNAGVTEFPFEFVLKPQEGAELFDSYHGVYVNINYMITADMARGLMAKNIKKQREFIVQLPKSNETYASELKAKPFPFKVTPESLQNVRESSKRKIPEFEFEGFLNHLNCQCDEALSGEFIIKKCLVEIKSIELQLVRIESCSYMEGEAREATEIQNIQIAEGNVVKGLSIPIYMVFPRLFTCSTTIAKQFKIEFEVNLIVLFADNHMVTENFPIKLYR